MDTDQPVTVGRIVHYSAAPDECRAAIVNSVGDKRLGLVVFFVAGDGAAAAAEQRYMGLEPGGDRPNWHWPERPIVHVSSPALEALASGS